MTIRKFSLFTKGKSDLLKEMFRKGNVTFKEQKAYKTYLGFYGASKILQKHKLMTCNGVTRKNEKVWVLTEKGKNFTNLLLEIENIVGEMN